MSVNAQLIISSFNLNAIKIHSKYKYLIFTNLKAYKASNFLLLLNTCKRIQVNNMLKLAKHIGLKATAAATLS